MNFFSGRHTGNTEPAGWIFRNFFFFGNMNFLLCFFMYRWMFSSVLFCVGIILFEVVMVLRFVYDLISTEENMWMGQN